MRLSYQNFLANASDEQKVELKAFAVDQSAWLDDYALFTALKDQHGGSRWDSWEEDITIRQPDAIERWKQSLHDQID